MRRMRRLNMAIDGKNICCNKYLVNNIIFWNVPDDSKVQNDYNNFLICQKVKFVSEICTLKENFWKLIFYTSSLVVDKASEINPCWSDQVNSFQPTLLISWIIVKIILAIWFLLSEQSRYLQVFSMLGQMK